MTDAPSPEQQRFLYARTATGVTPKRVRWLWRDRIPLGEITLIVGRGGVGKSTLLCTFAAWITLGIMKGEFYGTPRDVIYVVNEDSLDYTVVPRLIAAGADLSRVHFAHVRVAEGFDRVQFPKDCAAIRDMAKHYNAAVVMFDPLSSNISAKPNDQADMRGVLEKLRKVVEEADVAGMGLAHTRKAMSTNLMDAIMGSVELGNVTRAVMGVMSDPDEEGTVLLSQEKNNLGRMDLPSYKYRIETFVMPVAGADELEPPIETSNIKWLGKDDRTVSDMLSEGTQLIGKNALEEATEFVRAYLSHSSAGGEALKADVMKAGQAEGFSRPTIERAATRLKVMSVPSGKGAQRLWRMPPAPPIPPG